jgi:dihydroxyacetone kinase-like predicted kinase
MAVLYLDGSRLKRIMLASTQWLCVNEQVLNDLNVFPVPDGDTGTNMSATLKNIAAVLSDADSKVTLPSVAQDIAEAAVLGARGNSGVILSQIFKGFADSIGSKKRLNALDITYALKQAYEQAYNSISNPIEGTILTVVREGVEAAHETAKKEIDIVIVIETLLCESKKSLQNTPNLLPTLKEANVVDAGGLGFVYIIEGISMLLKGEKLPAVDIETEKAKYSADMQTIDDINSFFGYCNEFFIHKKAEQIDEMSLETLKKEKLEMHTKSMYILSPLAKSLKPAKNTEY